MSAGALAVDVLLGLACLVVLASAHGVLVMRGAADKLHFVAPLGLVAPVLVGLAVSVQSGWSQATGATWLAVGFVVASSPFLSHATIRAIRNRERGDWRSGVVRDPGGKAAG